MRIRYETGFATLVQFIVISLLNIGNMVLDMVSACTSKGGSCTSTIFTAPVVFVLLVIWFGFIAALGYVAQERRQRIFALVLFGSELLVLMFATLNVRHPANTLNLITSLADIAFSLWVMLLSFRLFLAGSSRIVTRRRLGRDLRRAP